MYLNFRLVLVIITFCNWYHDEYVSAYTIYLTLNQQLYNTLQLLPLQVRQGIGWYCTAKWLFILFVLLIVCYTQPPWWCNARLGFVLLSVIEYIARGLGWIRSDSTIGVWVMCEWIWIATENYREWNWSKAMGECSTYSIMSIVICKYTW